MRGGSLRFYFDFRHLNFITVPDPCSEPRIDEGLDSMGDALVNSILNGNWRYWKIAIYTKHITNTTFMSNYVMFMSKGMYFGLKTSL